MTIERAISILTPDETRYTPKEYAEALAMARESLANDLAVIKAVNNDTRNDDTSN